METTLETVKKGRVGKLLLELMRQAGIDEELFETTLVVQLALRLDGKLHAKEGLPEFTRCACAESYHFLEWINLKPTGYWMRNGERPEGQVPDFEGRICKHCGAEIRIPAGPEARAATPLWMQF